MQDVLDNPLLWVKLLMADGETEKRQGLQEMRCTWLSSRSSRFTMVSTKLSFPKKIWYLAQEKRKINSFKREKVNNPDHAHLSGIFEMPVLRKEVCTAILPSAHSKDKKNTVLLLLQKYGYTPTGT